VIDADGSDNVLLTSEVRHGQPAWSPDGTKILYTSGIREDLGFALFTIAPDGTGASLFLGGAKEAAWSPDGTMIAFASARTGNSDTFVMKTDGTGLVNLTNNPGLQSQPSWR